MGESILVRVAVFDEHGTRRPNAYALEERTVYKSVGDWCVTAGDPGLSAYVVTYTPIGKRAPDSATESFEYACTLCDAFAVVAADRDMAVPFTREELRTVFALAKRGMEAA